MMIFCKKQEECRKKIWDASGLLLELINEVLDMGKLESGEILLEEREFNLKKLLGDIVNVVEKQSKKNISLKLFNAIIRLNIGT